MRTEGDGLSPFALQSLSVRTLFSFASPDRHPAAAVHFVASNARAVRSCVTLSANRPQVRPGQSDVRVVDVFLGDRDYVVHDLGWCVPAFAHALFAEVRAAGHVRIAAALPGC